MNPVCSRANVTSTANGWRPTAARVREVHNPATGELLSTVPNAGAVETRRAIEAAQRAFPAGARRTAEERARVLRRWYELMLAHQEDLAQLMTSEQGKPLAESRGEISYAASFIEWFAEEARRVYGESFPRRGRTSASSSRASRSVCARRSRRGISRQP